MSDPQAELTEDLFLNGRLRLLQPKKGHRAGHDAILLAAATPARAGDRVVDFGAGVGTAGLAVARRVAGIDLVLVEIDTVLADLARKNIELNGLAARAVVLDVGADAATFATAGLTPDSVDALLMNPPFNDASRHRASPDAERQAAHMAKKETLPVWIAAARRILKSGGVLTAIWRADGLTEVLAALAAGFGSFEVVPVHPMSNEPAIRIVIKAVKGGRAPTILHPGLVLNRAPNIPSAEAQAIAGGGAILQPQSGSRGLPKT